MANVNDSKHLCFECDSCYQICPKEAIKMVENQEGFSYPMINPDKCIDCGLCIKACPGIYGNSVKHSSGEIYAAQSKDRTILTNSSSGGIFSIIAESFLSDGGIVFGAAWDKNLQLHHISVESIEGLSKLRGSKYVHSKIGDTYNEAKKYLSLGRKVYFTGTPCQIAGLRLFLRKDYPNLVTSDIICHGTPSQKMFNLFVKQMEQEKDVSLYEYKFRDKRIFGWSCSSSSSSIDKHTGRKKYHYYDRNMTAYFQAFIKGHITREDCYSCPFSCTERVGDITLADYWDITRHHPDFKNVRDGVSLIIVNSEVGRSLMQKISHRLILVNSSIENALNTSNHNLKAPTPRPTERDAACQRAFDNFESFRDYYASFGKPEDYYRHAFRMNRIKSLPILSTFFKLIGKA